MTTTLDTEVIALAGHRSLGSGPLRSVIRTVKETVDAGEQVLMFDLFSSRPVEVDLRGDVADVLDKLENAGKGPVDPQKPKGRGRPKLGVVGREVTLLPRQWDWLNEQPGGASVALRKLVDQARRANEPTDAIRRGKESVYLFMSAIGGDLPGYEEALRALFASDEAAFRREVKPWPEDLRLHLERLCATAFADE